MGVNYTGHVISDDDWLFYKKCAGWQFRFALLPCRCNLSGNRIWFKKAYRGTAFYGAGDIHFIQEHKWHTKEEHLIWLLKR